MTRTELIRATAKRAGVTQETAAAIIAAALDTAADALAAGDNVALHQFGKLEPRRHKERTMHSFITGSTIKTPASVYVGFVPAQALKDRLNGKAAEE